MTTTTQAAVATVRRVARAYAWRYSLDGDDVAGAALLRLIESAADMGDPRVLVRAAHNAAVDEIRRRNVRLRITAHLPIATPLIDPGTLALRDVWAQLSDDERLCALASGGPGMGEVAAELGITPWRASRMARSVRDRLLAAA